MKKLKIDKPCHENWEDFTPEPQGGFCGSCQKTVVDFTNKSNEDIRSFLESNRGQNLCGRIGTHQLDEFNSAYINWHQNNSLKAVQSKFIWALILTFGLSLFSSQAAFSQITTGKITYIEQTVHQQLPKDSILELNTSIDSVAIEEILMGDINIENYPEADSVEVESLPTQDKKACEAKEIPVKKQKISHPIIMGMMIYTLPSKNKDDKVNP